MIVLDASAVVELLANGRQAAVIRRTLAERNEVLIAPHLLDIEVTSALLRITAGQRVDAHRMEQLFAGLRRIPIERFSHTPLIRRIWELRHNFTCYDAAYIALAEWTGSTLLTCDRKLSKGHPAKTVVVSE